MAEVDLKKVTPERIRNGTWKYESGVFRQALEIGMVGFDGEDFIFPDEWGRKERKDARKKLTFILGLDTDLDSFYNEIVDSKFAFLIEEFHGLTVPAASSPYQALVEVIAQQQVNFEFAQRTIANFIQLADKRICDLYAFPSAEKITSMSEEEFKKAKLGYRAGYIEPSRSSTSMAS